MSNVALIKSNKYQKAKARARQKAIDFQLNFNENYFSFEEIAKITNYFHRIAKKYGLIKEFKENAII